MRRMSCLLLLMVAMATVTHAQTEQYPTGISFKKLFMDYQSQNGGNISNFGFYHHGFEIGYHKLIQPNVSLYVPLKFGVVNSYPAGLLDMQHKTVYGLDAQARYHFNTGSKQISPYALGGVGVVGENEGDLNVQVPLGFGVNIKVADNAYVNYQGEYRYAFSENRNNLHHGIGFTYLFKADDAKKMDKTDRDGDGIPNEEDLCPDVAGPKILNGCPDTDGDGVPDYKDKCIEVPGKPELNGCPDKDGDGIIDPLDDCPDVAGVAPTGCPEDPNTKDTDGDGIVDTKDKCPNIPGVAPDGCPKSDRDNDGVPDDEDDCPDQFGSVKAKGCPDNDNDGIPNSRDKCPNQAGPAAYDGCPDTDGDGLHDGRDRCPNSYGPVATGGCPEISSEDKKTLDIAMRAVQFDTGRSTLKVESYDVLKQIADIMRRYPDYNLVINGHTDNVGRESSNQILSERRAKACHEFLTLQGIEGNRMTYVGYGESRPIADNNSLRGQTLNRRVEFNLVPGR